MQSSKHPVTTSKEIAGAEPFEETAMLMNWYFFAEPFEETAMLMNWYFFASQPLSI